MQEYSTLLYANFGHRPLSWVICGTLHNIKNHCPYIDICKKHQGSAFTHLTVKCANSDKNF